MAFDEHAARLLGVVKAELERSGTVLSDLDLQIASIAPQYSTASVTHYQQHFDRIAGLLVEDWL